MGRFKRKAKAKNLDLFLLACFIFAIFNVEYEIDTAWASPRKCSRVERSLPKSNSRANLLYFPPCDPFSASEEWSFTLNAPQSLGVIQNSRNRYATHFRIPRLTYPFIPHSEREAGACQHEICGMRLGNNEILEAKKSRIREKVRDTFFKTLPYG